MSKPIPAEFPVQLRCPSCRLTHGFTLRSLPGAFRIPKHPRATHYGICPSEPAAWRLHQALVLHVEVHRNVEGLLRAERVGHRYTNALDPERPPWSTPEQSESSPGPHT